MGFDYYRTDTDRYQDRRIMRLSKDFGVREGPSTIIGVRKIPRERMLPRLEFGYGFQGGSFRCHGRTLPARRDQASLGGCLRGGRKRSPVRYPERPYLPVVYVETEEIKLCRLRGGTAANNV